MGSRHRMATATNDASAGRVLDDQLTDDAPAGRNAGNEDVFEWEVEEWDDGDDLDDEERHTPLPALIDVGFESFATPSIAAVGYTMVLLVFPVVGILIIANATFGSGAGQRALIVTPVVLVGILFVRLVLEATVILFRIEEHLRALRER